MLNLACFGLLWLCFDAYVPHCVMCQFMVEEQGVDSGGSGVKSRVDGVYSAYVVHPSWRHRLVCSPIRDIVATLLLFHVSVTCVSPVI